MTLSELIGALDAHGLSVTPAGATGPVSSADPTISAVEYDSRKVVPGAVFVGLRGANTDGTTFAAQAAAKGAAAIVSDQPAPAGIAAPWVHVRDGRAALAVLASAFSGYPSRSMLVAGITGTNGKTTTAFLVREIFEAAGLSCGLLGTVQYRVGAEIRDAARTTPEATDLQRMFREMVEAGCRACAVEVSSHALDLRRVDETRFAVGVFTNLTRDHLDYHQDMDRYFAAKRRLFEILPAGAPAVLNADDPRVASLVGQVPAAITFGIDHDADVRPVALPVSLMHLAFEATSPAGTIRIESRLAGRFNIYNLLAAAATGVAVGMPVSAIEGGLAAVTAVPGRLQVVSTPDDEVVAIVDYAHTDDALKNLLEAVRPLAGARLITVFGCGGDRDKTKRPLMGAVAARLSDRVVITSDNPRSEEPDAIIDDIERGIASASDRAAARASESAGRGSPAWTRIVDRRDAIGRAIAEAQPGDVIVIAGKGHEKTQVIRDRELPFDDVAVAQDALRARRLERAS